MSGSSHDESNPFRAPTSPIGGRDLDPIPDAEIIRRSYLTHESKVRSLGLLGYLAATLAFVLAICYAEELLKRGPLTFRLLPIGLDLVAGGILIAWLVGLAGFVLVLSFGLRRLAPWARWGTIAAAGLAFVAYVARYALALLGLGTTFFHRPGFLIGNTLGLLASGYVLLVLLSGRSGRVFGREYRAIVGQTPEIRPYVSGVVKVVLGGAAGLIGVMVLALAWAAYLPR